VHQVNSVTFICSNLRLRLVQSILIAFLIALKLIWKIRLLCAAETIMLKKVVLLLRYYVIFIRFFLLVVRLQLNQRL